MKRWILVPLLFLLLLIGSSNIVLAQSPNGSDYGFEVGDEFSYKKVYSKDHNVGASNVKLEKTVVIKDIDLEYGLVYIDITYYTDGEYTGKENSATLMKFGEYFTYTDDEFIEEYEAYWNNDQVSISKSFGIITCTIDTSEYIPNSFNSSIEITDHQYIREWKYDNRGVLQSYSHYHSIEYSDDSETKQETLSYSWELKGLRRLLTSPVFIIGVSVLLIAIIAITVKFRSVDKQ